VESVPSGSAATKQSMVISIGHRNHGSQPLSWMGITQDFSRPLIQQQWHFASNLHNDEHNQIQPAVGNQNPTVQFAKPI